MNKICKPFQLLFSLFASFCCGLICLGVMLLSWPKAPREKEDGNEID